MENEQLEQVLEGLVARHLAAEDQARRLGREVVALERAIAGLRELLEEAEPGSAESSLPTNRRRWRTPPPPTSEDYPRGVEAVRLVLMETGREMNVPEITEELIRRGWAPRSRDPQNATSSNAGRAVEVFPDIVRRRGEQGYFLYRFDPGMTEEEAGEAAMEADLAAREEEEVATQAAWEAARTEEVVP